MSVVTEKVKAGLVFTSRLDSFPVFCLYLLMILVAPLWKRIAPPLSLRPVLIVYNFACSVISLYSLLGFSYGLYQTDSTFSKKPTANLLPYFRIYWISKNIELLDTVFMILRHKGTQITFLHIYHHSSMVILSDLAYHFYPWPCFCSYLGLNSLVHVVLYMYYGLSAMYPNNPPPWKKLLTQFQILQFLIDFVHATIGYLYHGFCVYGIFYGIGMTWLFCNFYYYAYIKLKKVRKPENGDVRSSDNGYVAEDTQNHVKKD